MSFQSLGQQPEHNLLFLRDAWYYLESIIICPRIADSDPGQGAPSFRKVRRDARIIF